ncbi:10634_t:CDS:2 [Ambispora leptoticha]|uniref:10634_t:CDS:1 n=1 Tax=Ambispora leptoticha TaxID=144679 RepID=A0A9N8VYS8_9GLOM|nr:10634_t:CDS:2 [Ambispora leptoticha]
MDRGKKYQAPVYRSWNALALGLPNNPGETELEEPENKQPTKSRRPRRGVLVKEVIGQEVPSQIADWRYSNAVALNKVSEASREKKSHEIYESNKWNLEQKRKATWGPSSSRIPQQNNWNPSSRRNTWDSPLDTQQKIPTYDYDDPREKNLSSKTSFKPQYDNSVAKRSQSQNNELQSYNTRPIIQSKHEYGSDSWNSVGSKKNWNAPVHPEKNSGWDSSTEPQYSNDSWDSVEPQKNWNAPVRPEKNGNWGSSVKAQYGNDSWDSVGSQNDWSTTTQSEKYSNWNSSVKSQYSNDSWDSVGSQKNWNAPVKPEKNSNWDSSTEPQYGNDNCDSAKSNWNASVQQKHSSNWNSSRPKNENDNSVAAKKSQKNGNTSVQPKQTGRTLTDEPEESDHILPFPNPILDNLFVSSPIDDNVISAWKDNEKNTHIDENSGASDINKESNVGVADPTKAIPQFSKGTKIESKENPDHLKSDSLKSSVKSDEESSRNAKGSSTAVPIQPLSKPKDEENTAKTSSTESFKPLIDEELLLNAEDLSTAVPIPPSSKQEDEKVQENTAKTSSTESFKPLIDEELLLNAKDLSSAVPIQLSPKQEDEKVQKSTSKIGSTELFKSLIDEELIFDDTKKEQKNTNKREKSAFGWETEFKKEDDWPNFDQPLIESDSSDEESIRSNSSTKEPQSPMSPNLIDSFDIPPELSTSPLKPITIPRQKKPPEIKSPLRATIQGPESETVASYIFYKNKFVKENSVLVNLDDDQSALSPPKQPPTKESEDFLQELAKLDWKAFLPIPDPNSIKWAKPTDREQKRKKKEVLKIFLEHLDPI